MWLITLLFSLALWTVSSVSADCLDGFEHHGDRCYKVSALEASWIEAKHYCRLLGSDLLVIENAAEEKTIEGLLDRMHGSRIDEAYWISGADIVEEKHWQWLTSDGHSLPMNYTHWHVGRPDNLGGNQNCLIIVYSGLNTYWEDGNCNELHSFICEHEYVQGPISRVWCKTSPTHIKI